MVFQLLHDIIIWFYGEKLRMARILANQIIFARVRFVAASMSELCMSGSENRWRKEN